VTDPCIPIHTSTDTAEVRRTALDLASQLAFDVTSAGNLGLVVTEAAKNLLKHAGGGHVILHTLRCNGSVGIEVLALDKGPGIADVNRCFQDGYSTAGTPGTGLGAIARLSSLHEIYSRRDHGTVLMAQIWNRAETGSPAVRQRRFSVGGVCVAMPGEQESGDNWVSRESANGLRITVADGLGHGPSAADASRAAIRIVHEQPHQPAAALLERIHQGLRATRGAAVAVADIDPSSNVLRYAGVGNITAIVVPASGPLRRLVSHAGTAGHEVRKLAEFTYPWDSRSVLLMHSDGLQTQWSLDSYPGLLERHPSVIAGLLYRDHVRGRDDVTVVVAKEERALS
jgi:anti-sigma regulatory factor (Ser/Thr protein kinase)